MEINVVFHFGFLSRKIFLKEIIDKRVDSKEKSPYRMVVVE